MLSSVVRARVAACLGCSPAPSRRAPMANAYSQEAMWALRAASASASSAFSLSITPSLNQPAQTRLARGRCARSVAAVLARDHAAGGVERALARQGLDGAQLGQEPVGLLTQGAQARMRAVHGAT